MASQEEKPTWYVSRHGEKYGPFTKSEVFRRGSRQEVDPSDQFLQEGSQQWVAASNIPDLLPDVAEDISAIYNPLKNALRLKPIRFKRSTRSISDPQLGPGGRLSEQWVMIYCSVEWWGLKGEGWEQPEEVEIYIKQSVPEEPAWPHEWRGRMHKTGQIACYVSSEMFRHFWAAADADGSLSVEVHLEPDRVVVPGEFWVDDIEFRQFNSPAADGAHPVVAEIQKVRGEWGPAITFGIWAIVGAVIFSALF